MELNNIEMEVGETISISDIFIFRNEYAYIILRPLGEIEAIDNALLINDEFYKAVTVEDISHYSDDDFQN